MQLRIEIGERKKERERSIDLSRFKTIKVNFQLLEVGDSRYKRTGRGRNTMKMESIRAYSLPGVTRSEF